MQLVFQGKLDGPTAPNIEFEDPPPKAEPRSEPFPCCKITNTINTIARTMQIILIAVIIIAIPLIH